MRIYYENQLVAQHQRSFGKKEWIRDLSHYEKTLELKPRAKVMAYREKLLGLSSEAAAYVAEICRRDRNSMNQQILKLYAFWEEHGTERFLEAIRFCLEAQVYGVAYVELMLRCKIRLKNPHESGLKILIKNQPLRHQDTKAKNRVGL